MTGCYYAVFSYTFKAFGKSQINKNLKVKLNKTVNTKA